AIVRAVLGGGRRIGNRGGPGFVGWRRSGYWNDPTNRPGYYETQAIQSSWSSDNSNTYSSSDAASSGDSSSWASGSDSSGGSDSTWSSGSDFSSSSSDFGSSSGGDFGGGGSTDSFFQNRPTT